jgi:hypothetical protein
MVAAWPRTRLTFGAREQLLLIDGKNLIWWNTRGRLGIIDRYRRCGLR